jgi:hypothetical protein
LLRKNERVLTGLLAAAVLLVDWWWRSVLSHRRSLLRKFAVRSSPALLSHRSAVATLAPRVLSSVDAAAEWPKLYPFYFVGKLYHLTGPDWASFDPHPTQNKLNGLP